VVTAQAGRGLRRSKIKNRSSTLAYEGAKVALVDSLRRSSLAEGSGNVRESLGMRTDDPSHFCSPSRIRPSSVLRLAICELGPVDILFNTRVVSIMAPFEFAVSPRHRVGLVAALHINSWRVGG